MSHYDWLMKWCKQSYFFITINYSGATAQSQKFNKRSKTIKQLEKYGHSYKPQTAKLLNEFWGCEMA